MRQLLHLAILLTLALWIGGSLNAGEYQPLKGNFMIGGATLIDPPADEPRNTHYYFFLKGSSAQALYDAIDAPAVRDECRDDGSLTRSVGNIQCLVSADGADYQCTFGINLSKQSIEPGSAC